MSTKLPRWTRLSGPHAPLALAMERKCSPEEQLLELIFEKINLAFSVSDSKLETGNIKLEWRVFGPC